MVNSGSAGAQLTLGAVGQSGGTRSLTKTGNGTLVLGGAGSYTGGTKLALGVITLGVANALGSGGLQSIYLRDPDGNAIEVYVDTSDVWRTDPQAVASISPLTL